MQPNKEQYICLKNIRLQQNSKIDMMHIFLFLAKFISNQSIPQLKLFVCLLPAFTSCCSMCQLKNIVDSVQINMSGICTFTCIWKKHIKPPL